MSRMLKIGLFLCLIGIVLVVAVPLSTDNNIFSFNNEENFTLTEEIYDFDEFDSFNFDFDNRSVYIYESDDEFVHLSYYLHDKDILEFSDDTNELSFSISRKWYDNFFIFDFGIYSVYYNVYLFLPDTLIDSTMNIVSSNGQILIDLSNSFASVYVKSSNGKLSFNNVIADSITANTANGDIDMDNVIVTDKITGKTFNGGVNLNLVTASEIDFETSNGKIDAKNITVQNAKLESSNGKVYLSMTGNMDDFKINLSTTNGDTTLNDLDISSGVINPSQSNTIELYSSNGDVELKFLG